MSRKRRYEKRYSSGRPGHYSGGIFEKKPKEPPVSDGCAPVLFFLLILLIFLTVAATL